ncbi:hypothetical protein RHMOL_Rhmol08G0294900 [Rhododendron molle]|uniref:Uncharacterized protein n=1 Tax=Rhododendron molle TaxID=49168 RepID=A0ACC0MTR3_RHOML|nr:hypothetical protein RHMOL_Rhmol08G0294900 [Rhododendron molle]
MSNPFLIPAAGNANRVKTGQSLDKLLLEKFIAPLTTSMDSNRSRKLPSSMSVVGDNSSLWEGILPANRSTLSSYKKDQSLTVKSSIGLFCNEKILLIPKRKNIHHINHEKDFTTNSSVEEETKGKLIARCSLKKPKIENLTQLIEDPQESSSIGRGKQQNNSSSIIDLVKHEKVEVSDYRSFQSAQISSAALLREELIAQRSQKDKVVMPSPAPSGDEERKGSAFLIQVKEKLTDLEYEQFVACMKALKSKTMKIGQALESIVRIFSSPDRLPLLQRFKDYIPAKYHSLYEQCLKRNDDVIEL